MGVLMLVLAAVFFLTYKTELQDLIYEPVKWTLASLHKKAEEFEVTLSRELPDFVEDFAGTVPEMKTLSFRVARANVQEAQEGGEAAEQEIREYTGVKAVLTDRDTGDTLAERFIPLESLRKETVKLCLEKGAQTKDRNLTLRVSLQTAAPAPAGGSAGEEAIREEAAQDGPGTDVRVALTANIKQGLVQSVNGDAGNRTNIISEITYDSGQNMKVMYVILCALLLLFALFAYILLVMREKRLCRVYLPLALALGLVFSLLIPPYCVPDENIHIDNAYKYSNMILGVKSTGVPGTIYKRGCDVLQADQMANTLEGNHYRQLRDHLLERPAGEEKELTAVSYAEAGMMVPAINYIPCALGISLGRILGASSLMALTLGCYFSLVVFALLVSFALKLLPYGKNAAAMLMLLPIAMQQGASASYDAVLNGMILLFIACCLRLYEWFAPAAEKPVNQDRNIRMEPAGPAEGRGWASGNRKTIVLAALTLLLTFYLARNKGGVYLPLCLLLIPVVRGYLQWSRRKESSRSGGRNSSRSGSRNSSRSGSRSRSGQEEGEKNSRQKDGRKILIVTGIALAICLAAVIFFKFFWGFIAPMFGGSFQAETGQGYSIAGLLRKPGTILYKYWYTFQHSGETYIRGLMGGILSWLDINVTRIYPLMFLGGTILLAHTEGDRFRGKKTWRALLLAAGILCILLIMFSMLVAYTSAELDYISGVQGRYFLGFAILFFLGGTTGMIRLTGRQARLTGMCMMIVEILTVLSAVGKV